MSLPIEINQRPPGVPADDWLALLHAQTMLALAARLASWAGAQGARASLVWLLDAEHGAHVYPPDSALLAVETLAPMRPGESASTETGAHVLKLAGEGDAPWAALVCEHAPPEALANAWTVELEALVANALEKDRLRGAVARLEQAERVQRALYEITDMASSDLDSATMLAALHRIVGRLMYAENFFIALYDAATDSIQFIYFADVADDDWQDPDAIEPLSDIEGSLTWHLIRHAKPLMGPTSTLYAQVSGPLAIIGPGAADWLGVPIIMGRQVRAALVVQSYERGGLYTPVERDLLQYVGRHIVTAIDRKQAFERLEQQAVALEREVAVRREAEARLQHEVLHDPLTRLPNRAYLREHLGRAVAAQSRAPGKRFAVLFLDLDRFKVINDSAGHTVGDELLKAVAHRFAACLRPPDIVARLGGDEFAVIMHDIEGSDAPARLARRLIDALRDPIHVEGKDLFTGVSIGIVVSDEGCIDPEALLRDADVAMYRVKESGRGGFEIFDEALHRQALERLAVEGEIRAGLSRQEFVPFFQPVVDLADGAVLGYEALARWRHPQRGLLAPGAFLEITEQMGLLETLDWQLYECVCREIPALLREGQYVHLNISPQHFLGEALDVRLLALLQRHGVQPSQVRIEITEGALIEHPERVGACIERLRTAGIHTALDDFGTGYSSLSYLHRYRFHTIKLDRSFVNDLTSAKAPVVSAVVRAVIDLSRALGMEVIAEGVETREQARAVHALGCGLGQGYLYARPAPAESFRERTVGTTGTLA